MSRIGKKPVPIPDKVKVSIDNNILKAKGPKGELCVNIPENINYSLENNVLTFSRENDIKKVRAIHGLTRALSANVVEGVMNGFTKTLQIVGVGFKVEMRGRNLLLFLGFSHPVLFIPPEDITIATTNPNTIQVSGIDKQIVGEICAKIRALRPPEPYKGKGIQYAGEYIRRKAGKTTSK